MIAAFVVGASIFGLGVIIGATLVQATIKNHQTEKRLGGGGGMGGQGGIN